MFRVIDFKNLLKYFSLATTGVSILLYVALEKFFPEGMPVVRIFTIATWVSIFFLFLLSIDLPGRLIWKVLRTINKSLFPDLNGGWEGVIHVDSNMEIEAKAWIKQGLFLTRIDLFTGTSQSVTLEATPSVEAGQFRLYYTYRSTPKNPAWPTYIGSTIFHLRNAGSTDSPLELSGIYYTDRKTCGRVTLKKCSDNSITDISFY